MQEESNVDVSLKYDECLTVGQVIELLSKFDRNLKVLVNTAFAEDDGFVTEIIEDVSDECGYCGRGVIGDPAMMGRTNEHVVVLYGEK